MQKWPKQNLSVEHPHNGNISWSAISSLHYHYHYHGSRKDMVDRSGGSWSMGAPKKNQRNVICMHLKLYTISV